MSILEPYVVQSTIARHHILFYSDCSDKGAVFKLDRLLITVTSTWIFKDLRRLPVRQSALHGGDTVMVITFESETFDFDIWLHQLKHVMRGPLEVGLPSRSLHSPQGQFLERVLRQWRRGKRLHGKYLPKVFLKGLYGYLDLLSDPTSAFICLF